MADKVIRVDEATRRRLKVAAAMTGQTMSKLAETAIAFYLDHLSSIERESTKEVSTVDFAKNVEDSRNVP